jgi:hypothetical protein
VRELKPAPIKLQWLAACSHCGVERLSGEAKTFCCNSGNNIVPPLKPLPAEVAELAAEHPATCATCRAVSTASSCLASSALRTAGLQWKAGRSPSLQGRTYHRLMPASTHDHPIHWVLYDETDRYRKGAECDVPPPWIDLFRDAVARENPIFQGFEEFRDQEDHEDHVLEIRCAIYLS